MGESPPAKRARVGLQQGSNLRSTFPLHEAIQADNLSELKRQFLDYDDHINQLNDMLNLL